MQRSPSRPSTPRGLTGLSLALTLVLASCSQSSVGSPPTAATPSAFVLDPGHSYLEGQLVVGLRDGQAAQGVATALGAQVISELPELHAAVLRLPAGLTVEKAIRLAANTRKLRYAEPNYLARTPETAGNTPQGVRSASVTPQDVTAAPINDPQLGQQWFLANMGVYKAWATATGKGIRIGVADTDIDRNHPDLKANILYPGYDTTSGTPITADTPYDGIGEHGTWVAGTAAAVGNNGIGGAGVAYQASIVPITITHDQAGNSTDADAARAFIWAVNGPDDVAPGAAGDTDTPAGHKGYVDIINYSSGSDAYAQLSKEAIDYALSKGVVFVNSAGNTPTTGPSSPSWDPGVISVAATTPYNVRTDFSNRGSHLSVAAPGANIWTTSARSDTTNPNEVNYAYLDGTSFSSPATAGVAALVLQASATKNADGSVAKITLTPAQVRHILEDTAYKPTGAYTIDTGNGVVRADAAVLRATQDAANTVEKGASVSLKFVAQSDNTVGIPLVGVTLAGGRRPDQFLYAQSATGTDLFPEGYATFREIDAGSYQLYASGPRTVILGGVPGTVSGPLSLAAGSSQGYAVPLNVALPQDSHEPNNTLATATPIGYGNVMNGTLTAGDLDVYTFAGTQGETAFVNTQTLSGSPDTRIEILGASGAVLASNSSQRDGVTDAALDFVVPASGTYYIAVDDEGGSGSPYNGYSVSLSRVVGKETEPNGSATISGANASHIDFTGANPIAVGQALDAAIDPVGDVDIYTFTGTAGQTIVADINAAVSGHPDGVLSLYQAGNATALATVDDTNTPDPTIEFTLPADGTYYLVMSAYTSSTQKSTGNYRISLDAR